MNSQIKACPRCDEKVGWWEKRRQSYRQYFDANGTPSHATDADSSGRGGRRKFCFNCDRDITDCITEKGPSSE